MRTVVTRNRIVVAAVAAVFALAWSRPPLDARVAQAGAMGGAAGTDESKAPVPRVYFQAPYSADRARVWTKLQQKVPMKYANETALEDVLKAIKAATVDKDMPEGLPIYVDPVGLTEAEKTLASPVTIDLDSIRLETGLRLVLKQLDLTFRIHPDGLLYITSAASEDVDELEDANALILDKLQALQNEVVKLRAEIHHSRGVPAK